MDKWNKRRILLSKSKTLINIPKSFRNHQREKIRNKKKDKNESVMVEICIMNHFPFD